MLLEPLGPDESGALLDGLAGGGALPPTARDRITRAAGGNPLFIEELLTTLVDEGRLRRQDGGWEVAGDLAASGTPPTIQALVAARLDRLDGGDRDVLERAAVVGQAFESATVAELSPPAARDGVPARLRGLVRREFLRPAPARLPTEAAYQFCHLLVRDAVYAAVPKQARAELHERLAGLLEARAGARVREYEEIVGYHLEQAWRFLAELGPIDRRGRELGARAAGRLAAAGRRARCRSRTASTAAAGCWPRRPATATWRAACSTSWPPWRPCRAASTRPATWSRRAPRSRPPWARSNLAADGDPGRAAGLAREAVELAEATDMLNLRADAWLDLAETAELLGRPEEAAAAAANGLPLYERKGNQVAAAAVRGWLGLAPEPLAGEHRDAG